MQNTCGAVRKPIWNWNWNSARGGRKGVRAQRLQAENTQETYNRRKFCMLTTIKSCAETKTAQKTINKTSVMSLT